MKTLSAVPMAVIMFITACCSSKTMAKKNENATSLYGTQWNLKKIYTEEGVREAKTKAFIRFDKEKNSAGGNGSCNSFGSTTTINGSELSLKNIFSTKMFCEEVQSLEDVFFRMLEKTTSYKINGKKLELLQGDIVLLEFLAE